MERKLSAEYQPDLLILIIEWPECDHDLFRYNCYDV